MSAFEAHVALLLKAPALPTLTWGATKTSHITYSEGGALATFTNTSGSGGCLGGVSMAPNSGKYYWEVTTTGGATQFSAETPFAGFGWVGIPDLTASSINDNWGLFADGTACDDGSGVGTSYSGGVSTAPRRIMFAYDSFTRQWWAGYNGSWFSSGNPATGANPGPGLVNAGMTVTPLFRESFGWNATSMLHGRGSCYYNPPAGFTYLGDTPVDPVVTDWIARVSANGGTVRAVTQNAVNRFVISAKGMQYWSKFLRLNLFCGDQLAAALVPLKKDIGINGPDVASNGTGNITYSEAVGCKGVAGSNNFIYPNVNPSLHLTANNTHVSFYIRSPNIAGWQMGIYFSGSDAFGIGTRVDNGRAFSQAYNGVDGAGRCEANVNQQGLMVGNRRSSSVHQLRVQSAIAASNSGTGGVPPNGNFYICAYSTDPGLNIAAGNDTICAGYSIGTGLSDNDAANYNVDMHLFQAALSRNMPWA